MLAIAVESPLEPEITALLAQAQAFAASLYPVESNHSLDAARLIAAGARFFVARLDDLAIGCVAVCVQGEAAELKSLFVAAAGRGKGCGIGLLAHAEQTAQTQGATVMQLETGPRNDAALALYRRQGYRERGPFGAYRMDPWSVFMERGLSLEA